VTFDKPLSNFEIDDMMKKYGDLYLGTIAHNQIITNIVPKVKPESRGGFIINMDNAGMSGSHWSAVWFDGTPNGEHSIEYYDSFGRLPDKVIMTGMKAIAKKLQSNTYIKMKINRICEQNNTSANCGFFSLRFIIAKINHKHFTDATSWNDRIKHESLKGEQAIEKWKTMHGYGVFKYLDSFANKVKEGAKNAYNRVKTALTGKRDYFPTSVKNWLKQHGTETIRGLTVVREPINKYINKALDLISLGGWEKAKSELGYADMFHLFLIIDLPTDNARIERNHVIEMYKNNSNSYPNAEKISLPSKGITLDELMNNVYKKYGSSLLKYNASDNNCQVFLQQLLSASGLLTSGASSFIMQNAKALIDKLHPIVKKVIDTVTDVAGAVDNTADTLVNGGRKRKIIRKKK
jgi:hypothetical protein